MNMYRPARSATDQWGILAYLNVLVRYALAR
jgi:hypothetical protein